MTKRPALTSIVSGLLAKREQAVTLHLAPKAAKPATPLADLLGNPLPPATEFEQAWIKHEQAQVKAEAQREARPHESLGPDPRLPWIGKGKMRVTPLSELTPPQKELLLKKQAPREEVLAKGQERVKLNEAIAKAKRGQRLTLKDRKLLGKWELARIMARLRPKGGDCG